MKTIVISGRGLEHMHGSQVEFVGRTIARALAGEDVDQRDLVPYGIKISVGPAAVLSAAADYLDDGFHPRTWNLAPAGPIPRPIPLARRTRPPPRSVCEIAQIRHSTWNTVEAGGDTPTDTPMPGRHQSLLMLCVSR
jgi:hypothetical protein